MKTKVSRKNKSNVVYISSYKKRNVVKPYAKFDLDWQEILRANNSDKRLAEAAVILSARVAYELHRNNDRPVFLTPDWFAKVTKKQRHQSGRLRHQIDHIFNFEFRPKVRVDGILLSNVYEVWYTVESQQILNLEDVKILQEAPAKTHELGLVSCSTEATMVEQKCYMGGAEMLQPIVDKEKEEEPKGFSSSFSNNEKLKIKSFFEPAPQEEITNIPTLATGYPTEPAKVYQTEEIRSEATQEVTNCDRLGGVSLLQDIPLLANLLNPCDESPTIDNLSTVTPQTTEKHEEVIPMKEQIPIENHFENVLEMGTQEPERNIEFELSGAIFKSFGGVKSDEIMEHCKFMLINEDKLGVQMSNGFSLTASDKDRLKACIRLVYGDNINIVSSTVLKIAQSEPEILVKPQIQQYYRHWTRFRNDLLNYLPEKTGHHSLNAWFDKLRVSEDLINNRIILTGSRFYVDSVYNRFETAIEHVVKKNKVTLELHFENNDEKPIIYKPNGGF